MQIEAAKKRFTVTEYYKMADVGILAPRDRVELIEGEIIEMSAMGAGHAALVRRVSTLLMRVLDRRAAVGVQLPVYLDRFNEPEPDISVARLRSDFYHAKHPGPEDVFLLLEIADSSLDFDSGPKTAVYAAAAIPETWVLDLRGNTLLVYRDPSRHGYENTRSLGPGESISLLAFPDLKFGVREMLP